MVVHRVASRLGILTSNALLPHPLFGLAFTPRCSSSSASVQRRTFLQRLASDLSTEDVRSRMTPREPPILSRGRDLDVGSVLADLRRLATEGQS